MPHGRKRLSPALSALAIGALATAGLVSATPAQADPDIDDVQARVDRLYHEAEVAQERYNDARIDLRDLRGDLSALKADERRQGARLDTVRSQVSESILRQYQGESVSSVGQVVVSEDPSQFLGQLSTMSAFTDMQAGMFESYSDELEALDLRREATAERTDEIAERTAQLEEEKDTVAGKLAEAKELLGDLEAEERQQMRQERQQAASRSQAAAPAPSAAPASGSAGAAVQYGLAQVGDAYVYGATGEDAFDCSGLTMRAWAQAGVALPHSSSGQMSSGAPVSEGDLQPGDLVFYYSPVSHVGMYIGNGQIVHAANPSTGVQVTSLHSMPYSGAVRPG